MKELKEPLSERDTIFFFNAIQEYTPWRLAYCGKPFPDAIISNGYETLLAEFEYKAANFVKHGHDPQECDLVVCWLNDWEDAPIPILSLLDMSRLLGIKYERREKRNNVVKPHVMSFAGEESRKRIATMQKDYSFPKISAKSVRVTASVDGKDESHTIDLPGVLPIERLTPQLAAQAAFIVFDHRCGVTVSDTVTAYRLYVNSHRKLSVS